MLFPFLVNLAIDWVMKRTLEGDKLGIVLDDMIIADLENADDICLLEENKSDAQRILNKVTQTSAYVDLQINVQKTKFCSNNPNAKFTVKNELLERVDEFTYLGSRIALKGSVTSEVKARIGKAVGALASLNHIWKQKKIPRNIKNKIFNACVKAILLYES